jgi:hypothetical protein
MLKIPSFRMILELHLFQEYFEYSCLYAESFYFQHFAHYDCSTVTGLKDLLICKSTNIKPTTTTSGSYEIKHLSVLSVEIFLRFCCPALLLSGMILFFNMSATTGFSNLGMAFFCNHVTPPGLKIFVCFAGKSFYFAFSFCFL